MGFSYYNIRKWIRMLAGKSEMHVNQTLGTHFIPGELHGYFNNMTEKVIKEPYLVDSDELPMNHAEQGDVVFPVTIFQYALGLYDLYLDTNENRYFNKFLQLANWAVEYQEPNGAWDNFSFIFPDAPYGSMCQGEGASVLVRAFKETGRDEYLIAAKKAIDYMLLPLEDGGTAQYREDDLLFYEFTNKPVVLNGWIFSIFGIYDLNIISDEYKTTLEKATSSLIRFLPKFDNGFWSMYDLDHRIASPFYHDLHIAQMEALFYSTGCEVFKKYGNRFQHYKGNKINYLRAFLIKAVQKIME